MGKIYELLDPPDGLTCWIGSEYRENKTGKSFGVTYVYSDCRGSGPNCSGDRHSCHNRYHTCSGDPDTVRLFIDSEWCNPPFPEIWQTKGADLSILYPERYRRISGGEFMEILNKSYEKFTEFYVPFHEILCINELFIFCNCI